MSRPLVPPSKAGPLLIVLAYVGFISLGLPDAVIGVAWPSVRGAFEVDQSALGLILIAAGGGYFLSSFFSGSLSTALGIGLPLATSTALVAGGAFGFALAPIWAFFLACAFVHGLGSGAIDAGLNGYAAAHLSARQMNWLHACYCLGAMLGPLLMTAVLSTGSAYSLGYSLIGAAMAILAALFAATHRLWGRPPTTAAHPAPMRTGSALRHPAVLLHMSVFFLYTGLEVTVGQWSYTVLTESRGIVPASAGVWVSIYWGSIGVGRVLFGIVVEHIGIDRLLRFCLVLATVGALFMAVPALVELALGGLVLVGLGLAPVYPGLMTRTPQRLGPALAAHAVGFQVGAAMIGAALIPGAVGVLAEQFGLEAVFPAALALAGLMLALHEVLARWSSSPRDVSIETES